MKLPIESGTKVWNPVQVVRGPDDLMYVANNTGEIYALEDTDGDGIEDYARFFCDVKTDGLRAPTSIIFKDEDLYVGTAQEVRIYSDRDKDGIAEYSETFFDNIPHSEHPYEWTSGLSFDNHGNLYLVLTTDSWHAGAAADPEAWRGALLKIAPDGSQVERYATGLRSVPATVFDEETGLWLVDNQGGGNFAEELILVERGRFYGHNPEKYGNPEITEATLELKSDIAPSGMAFNQVSNDFDQTGGDLFVSYYGPGERWARGSISRVRISQGSNGGHQLEEHKVLEGLPKVSDLEFGFQGDLYATLAGKTDYWYQALEEPDGAIYRIVYAPWVQAEDPEAIDDQPLVADESLEKGRQLFVDRACNACHAIDGKTEMLGPNLKDVGRNFSREELLEEITDPSARIKPSMAPTQITKKNGELLIGRVVSNNQETIKIMVTGNRIIEVPQSEVEHQETVMVSMMYPGLLSGLEEEDVDALLSYLESLHLPNE
jgi:putative heme-binding domain-containing protein